MGLVGKTRNRGRKPPPYKTNEEKIMQLTVEERVLLASMVQGAIDELDMDELDTIRELKELRVRLISEKNV